MRVHILCLWGMDTVPGTPVVFHGFEEFAFAVHDSLRGWCVSELSTGHRVNSKDELVRETFETKELAVTYAAIVLNRAGKRRVRGKIEAARSKVRKTFPPNVATALEQQAKKFLAGGR